MSVTPVLRHSEKVALIVNRHSRTARKEPRYIENLEKVFGNRGPFIASQTPSELPDAVADLVRASPDLVFISGGDGTLRQTLTHLIAGYGNRPLPKIAILKGGTMNAVATGLGIAGNPLEQMELILYRHDRSIPLKTVHRTLLNVNGHYGFIFALGGFSRFIEHYQTEKDPTPTYAFTLLTKTVISMIGNGSLANSFFKEFRANIWRDKKPWLQDSTLTNISASSIRHIGFHFKPYYGAEGEDGSFGLLIFKTLPRQLLLHLPKLFFGKLVSDPTLLQVPAHDLLIKVDEPMRPMLDGDILKAEREFQVVRGPSIEMVLG